MSYFSRWRFIHWFGLLLVIGSVLRLYALGTAPVWYDEIVTSWASTLPFARLIQMTAGDVHPAGYYALIWVIDHVFNANPSWLLRLPSALFSIAAMPLLGLIGRRMKLSDAPILFGMAFMAFSPFQIYYAQEIRMYALLQLEILLAVLAVMDRRWWLLALASSAMLWSHNYGAVYCLLIFAWALVLCRRTWVALLVSGLTAIALYLPWMPTLLRQVRNMDKWWQQPTTPGGFLDPFQQFMWGNPQGMLSPVSEIITFSLLAFAIWKVIRLRSSQGVQLLLLGVAPMIFSVATELFMHPTYLYRTFIGSSGFIYLLVGWSLTERVEVRLTHWAYAMLAPMFALGVIFYYPVTWDTKGATDTFLVEIQHRVQPGDLIYHMNAGSLMSFRDAHPDKPEFYTYVHPAMAGDVGMLSSETLDAFGIQQVTLDQLPWNRAWLIWAAGPTIGVAEDNELASLVARYHGQPILDTKLWYSDVYKGQIWLLTR